MSATTRRRPASSPRSRATCCRAGLSAAADRRRRQGAHAAPASRSTSSTPRLLHDLGPDLIVTQALCSVCAVSYDDVRAVAEEIDSPAAGDRARPAHGRRGRWATRARWRRRPTARTPRVELVARRRRRGSTGCGWPCAAPGGRAVAALEWLDPAVRRRPLDPAADRATPAARMCSGFAGETSEERSWEQVAAAAARRRDRDAVRLRRRDRPPRGRDAPRPAGRAGRRRGRRRRRRRRTSRAPARASSTGSSCSRTSFIPSCSRRRRAAALTVEL